MRAIAAAIVSLSFMIPVAPPSAGAAAPRAARGTPGVERDAEGVPHITAPNDREAMRLLGYVHAEDRLFQMDSLRRQLSGTLAELLGAGAIASDIQFRTLGLRRAADASFDAYSRETRELAESYAAGVNAAIADMAEPPPEYAGLELTKAGIPAWTALDSLTIGKGIAFGQSFDTTDLELTVALAAYQEAGEAGGFDGAALFFEDAFRAAPFDPTVTVPNFLERTARGPASASSWKAAARNLRRAIRPETVRLARQYLDAIRGVPALAALAHRGESVSGSNWWVVSGDKTTTGNPMLASDPHLSLPMAPVFYEVHIRVTADPARGPMNVAGVSFAGAPAVILGVNDRIAWALTYNPLDVTDFYQEKITFNFRTARLKSTTYGNKKEKLVLIPQEFRANLAGNGTVDDGALVDVPPGSGGVTYVVPRRNNGPIISVDTSGGLDDLAAISVQYTGWGPTRDLEAFLAFARAETVDEFAAGVRLLDMPTLNAGVVTADGRIAYFTSGELPLREDLEKLGRVDGVPPFLVRDGTHAFRNEWIRQKRRPADQAIPYRILPFEEMPNARDPEAGYIANGNNDPVGTTLDGDPLNDFRFTTGGLYYLNVGYEGGFRAGRIARLLDAALADGGRVSLDDMARIQSNNQMLDAEALVPFVVDAFEAAGQPGAPAALASIAADPRVAEAVARLASWQFGAPTGIREGYDPGDDPENLPEPAESEVRASVAATIYSVWRSRVMANTIDATLARVGLGAAAPVDSASMAALRHLLDTFPTARGVGASGLSFFEVAGAPSPEAARDIILLGSLAEALDALAGDAYAAAFARSTDQLDYRWGRLHRIVFAHPLGAPFDVPNTGGFTDLAPGLPGVPKAGGYGVVDASSHAVRASSANDFMFAHGPARRFVGQVSPTGSEAFQIIPGGQSGDVRSPHYASQLGRWLTNRFHPLALD